MWNYFINFSPRRNQICIHKKWLDSGYRRLLYRINTYTRTKNTKKIPNTGPEYIIVGRANVHSEFCILLRIRTKKTQSVCVCVILFRSWQWPRANRERAMFAGMFIVRLYVAPFTIDVIHIHIVFLFGSGIFVRT